MMRSSLILNLALWSSFLIIPNEALTPDELSALLDDAIAFKTTRTDLTAFQKQIERMVGGSNEKDLEKRGGEYNDLLQAYHYNVYGSRFYDRGFVLMKWWGEALTRIRRYHFNWKAFEDLIDDCKAKRDKYNAVRATNPDGDEMKSFVNTCGDLELSVTDSAKEEFELNLKKGVIYATHLFASFFHLACEQGSNKYRFNGKVVRTSNPADPQIDLFNRMNQEYLDLGNAIPKLLGELDAHLGQLDTSKPYGALIEEASRKIHAKITAPPFDMLYVEDAATRQAIYDDFKELRKDFCGDFYFSVEFDSSFVDEYKFAFDWDTEMIDLEKMNAASRGPWKQFKEGLGALTPKEEAAIDNGTVIRIEWGEVPAVEPLITDFYRDYMEVHPLPQGDRKRKEFELWDGRWNWEIDGTTNRSLIHRMQLGTDLLDSVVEELKCYLNQTFNTTTRDKMIKDYTESVDWENAKMYMDISPTLARPCVTASDTDLVGSCTRENHEICMPMYYNTEHQDPLDETKGGMSLMKPKWYYRKDKDGICKGKRTYITHYKICQCGFRQDCGSDLKGSPQITCQFVENDLYRKQCRGSIAYPCKTHPFEKGEYHKTCATGFCDVQENSCERWHWHIFE